MGFFEGGGFVFSVSDVLNLSGKRVSAWPPGAGFRSVSAGALV